MPKIAKSTIAQVHDLNIKDVVEKFNIPLRRSGANYVCCCPFHSERTPSFSVSPRKNIAKCFSCGKGGDPITFVREYLNLDYPEAIIKLAEDHGITIEYDEDERSDEEKAKAVAAAKERERMLKALTIAQAFFIEQLNADNEEAAAAREYAYGRWGREYCDVAGIGFAPKNGRIFIDWLKSKGHTLDMFVNVGVLGKDEETGNIFSSLRWRVTIPVKNKTNQVISFTARYIGDNQETLKGQKYLNLKGSSVFAKSDELFGLNIAAAEAAKKEEMVIVEGGPDAMRMHIIGVKNAVAPLGTALSLQQLRKIKRFCRKLIFIPDSDAPKEGALYGAGVAAVMRNGKFAIDFGFDVYVKEIPRTEEDDKNGVKNDADSYITSMEIYNRLPLRPFVLWYASKKAGEVKTEADAAAFMSDVCDLMQSVRDPNLQELYISELKNYVGTLTMWRATLKRSEKRKEETVRAKAEAKEDERNEKSIGVPKLLIESLSRNGFRIKDGGYSTYDKDGNEIQCSNFWFEPVLHIQADRPKRIYRIHNNAGIVETIELYSNDMVTGRDLNKKLFDCGNFIWKGDIDSLTRLQQHLLEVTPSAEQIDTLGWNPKYEFYSFANGIFANGKLHQVNDLGVVEIDGNRRFYLPAFSSLFVNSGMRYNFERRYKCNPQGATTLHAFANQVVKVYGSGGMVSFAWTLATVFRDIVHEKYKFFPVLNLFGRKGSGKTELARALSSMFFTLPSTPDSCSNTSIPVIGYNLSHAANAVYILDEYTNDLMPQRIDLLKGLWGGSARSKMEEKSPVFVPVLSGVILAGQYRPEDEAIFSRCIHLMYSQTSFTREEKKEFNALADMVSHGNTHLLLTILALRNIFEKGFVQSFEMTVNDVLVRLGNEKVEDRILKNWAVALAAFRVLEPHLSLPFTYNDLFEAVVNGIIYQNEQIRKNSDTANFWQFLDAMHTNGKIKEKCHFVIKLLTSFAPIKKERTEYVEPKRIIFLYYKAVKPIFMQYLARQRYGTSLDTATMESYLKSMPQFLGIKQHRFLILRPNGELEEEYKTEGPQAKKYMVGTPSNALCFDYDSLKELFDLSLETFRLSEDDLDNDEDISAPTPAPPPSSGSVPSLFSGEPEEDMPF